MCRLKFSLLLLIIFSNILLIKVDGRSPFLIFFFGRPKRKKSLAHSARGGESIATHESHTQQKKTKDLYQDHQGYVSVAKKMIVSQDDFDNHYFHTTFIPTEEENEEYPEDFNPEEDYYYSTERLVAEIESILQQNNDKNHKNQQQQQQRVPRYHQKQKKKPSELYTYIRRQSSKVASSVIQAVKVKTQNLLLLPAHYRPKHQIQIPQVKASESFPPPKKFDFLSIGIPKFNIPNFELPKLDIPKLALPKIKLPTFASSPPRQSSPPVRGGRRQQQQQKRNRQVSKKSKSKSYNNPKKLKKRNRKNVPLPRKGVPLSRQRSPLSHHLISLQLQKVHLFLTRIPLHQLALIEPPKLQEKINYIRDLTRLTVRVLSSCSFMWRSFLLFDIIPLECMELGLACALRIPILMTLFILNWVSAVLNCSGISMTRWQIRTISMNRLVEFVRIGWLLKTQQQFPVQHFLQSLGRSLLVLGLCHLYSVY